MTPEQMAAVLREMQARIEALPATMAAEAQRAVGGSNAQVAVAARPTAKGVKVIVVSRRAGVSSARLARAIRPKVVKAVDAAIRRAFHA